MPSFKNFPHTVNGVGVDVHVLRQGYNGAANLLLHGYAGVTDDSDIQEFTRIASTLPDATNILLRWDAGSLVRPGIDGVRQRLAETPFPATRPADLAVSLLSGAISAMADAFEVSKENADRLSFAFGHLLDLALQGQRVEALTIIGHSLGGRIILQAAANHSLEDFPLRDFVVMGAAAPWPDSLFPVLRRTNVRLINLYSPADKLLSLDTAEGPCVGRHGLPVRGENLLDIPCNGYGHTDYWPNLDELAQLVGFAGYEPLVADPAIFSRIPMRRLQALYFHRHPSARTPLRERALRRASRLLAKLARQTGKRA